MSCPHVRQLFRIEQENDVIIVCARCNTGNGAISQILYGENNSLGMLKNMLSG